MTARIPGNRLSLDIPDDDLQAVQAALQAFKPTGQTMRLAARAMALPRQHNLGLVEENLCKVTCLLGKALHAVRQAQLAAHVVGEEQPFWLRRRQLRIVATDHNHAIETTHACTVQRQDNHAAVGRR